MNNNTVERALKRAVERAAPDRAGALLAQCEQGAGALYLMPAPRPAARRLMALAAAFVLMFSGFLGTSWLVENRVDARVMLDVNPSLEITLNRNDRVLDVAANNGDAVKILDGMNLKNTDVNVAVNALIGSMLKYGYIQENANSVLLTVEGGDGTKSALLQKNLADSIRLQLYTVDGAVLSQVLAEDGGLRALAETYHISNGKAALVQAIIDQNSHLAFADLAALSVNELGLLVGSKHVSAAGMELQGMPGNGDYIGEARAVSAALAHAGVTEAEAVGLRAELDYDDGMMVYDVEFFFGDREYDYEIGARDGAVLSFDTEGGRYPGGGSAAQSGEPLIGESRAADIAQAHAGVAAVSALSAELDKDDGRYIYEVEFRAGGREYDYDIDAVTGEIRAWKFDD